jgi:two-component system alkaline phosphatase synthesis response regulator PhoP
VRAMLRRPRHVAAGPSAPPDLPLQRFGDLTIDHARHEAALAGTVLSLTPLEFALLTVLAEHPGRVFTRTQLLEHVWGQEYFGDDHVVDVHIANLRKKLGDDPGAPRFVETVRGVGYRFAGRPHDSTRP